MVSVNTDPNAGGNTDQPDDGRDAQGRLPAPLDAAHYPNLGPAIILPGMPLGQPASDAGSPPPVEPPAVDAPDAPGGGMTTANAGALTGATGLAKAKRPAKT